jgi:hypothetical protein
MPATRRGRSTTAQRGRGRGRGRSTGTAQASPPRMERRSQRTRVPVQFADGTIFPQPQTPGQHQDDDPEDEGNQPGQDEEEDSGFISPLERLEQRLEQQRAGGGAQLGADQSITITRGDLDRIAEQMVARLQGVPTASQGVPTASQGIPTASQGVPTAFQGVAPAQPSMFPPFQVQTDSEDVEVPASLREMFAGTGVDNRTILEIAQNRFKALNLFRLLSSEREQADARGVASLNLDSMRVERVRTYKERDYKDVPASQAAFFRAWELYKAVFVATAPISSQTELSIALAIYTANLYELATQYSWNGMRAYHFSFHQDQISSGSERFNPRHWRALDSTRVISKCVPALLNLGSTSQATQALNNNSFRDNSFRDRGAGTGNRQYGNTGSLANRVTSAIPNICRNYNNGRCSLTGCRYRHQCEQCGGEDHGSFRCPQRSGANSTTLGGGRGTTGSTGRAAA